MLFLSFFLRGSGTNISAQNIDSITRVLKVAKDDTNKVNTLNKLSRQLNNTGEHEKSLKYANEAITISQKLSFTKGVATSYKNIGNIYINQSNYPKALEYYLQSLKAFEYNNIGIIYKHQKDYSKALEYYLKALKIREEIKDKQGLGGCFNDMAELYNKLLNYKLAR